MKVNANEEKQDVGGWLNNRAEKSRLPFRWREHAMLGFRRMRRLQMFAAVHSSVHNHFDLERRINDRAWFKKNRKIAGRMAATCGLNTEFPAKPGPLRFSLAAPKLAPFHAGIGLCGQVNIVRFFVKNKLWLVIKMQQ